MAGERERSETETGRAIVGDTMTVWARVHNIGKQQYGRITVEAWVCDYTAGPLPTGRLGNPGDLIGFQRAAIAWAPRRRSPAL